MRIEREGDRVEIRRNKRQGLKLKIMETTDSTGQVCRGCLLWKNTTGICGDGDTWDNLDPCGRLGLNRRQYFVYED